MVNGNAIMLAHPFAQAIDLTLIYMSLAHGAVISGIGTGLRSRKGQLLCSLQLTLRGRWPFCR